MVAQHARDRFCRRVLVVDDHAVFAELLTLALDGLADFHCVGVAASVSDAVDLAARLRPDIVVIDLLLGDEDGLEVVRQLRAARADVVLVVVSARSDAGTVTAIVAADANGFAPKSGAFGETASVLRRARAGSFFIPPSLLARTAAPTTATTAATLTTGPLTGRESDVLSLMGHGASAPEIARILNISLTTCRGHVRALHRKLGVSTQLGAVIEAERIGLIGPLQSG
jgi:DNA-binding NarL/FixJ family response regulator